MALSEIMKEYPIPKFHPSVEREVERFITERISDFYSMDYSTMTSYVNVDKLKEALNDHLSHQTIMRG